MRKSGSDDSDILRLKAEVLLKSKPSKSISKFLGVDNLKLIHEVEVYKIELELQQEELMWAEDHAKAEAEELSNEKYAQLFDSAPSGYFTLSKEGEIIDLNRSGADMLGLKYHSVIKSQLGVFVSTDTKPIFDLFLRSIFKSKEKETCEVSLNGNDKLPVHVFLTGHTTEKGEQCLITINDITGRKQAEYALREMHCRLESIIEGTNVGTWEWNVVTGETIFNGEWAHIIGYTLNELAPVTINTWKTFTHPDDLKDNIAQLDRHFRGEQPYYDSESRMRHKNGHWVWVRSRGRVTTRTPDGKPLMMYGTHTDITEGKQVQEELELKNAQLLKLNNEKDKFFSIIAHDLRSPFNGLLGLTEILTGGLPGMTMEQIQRMILLIRSSATNLFILLDNLLEWSRMQRGLTTFVPVSFLLMSKITECMVLLTEEANKKEIAISFEIPEDMALFTDENMVGSIFRNLMTNAVKFTPKGGKIKVSARSAADKSVEISIKDTGIGMSKKMMNDLFHLDVRTNRKGTEDEFSTGLGLIICKDLIENIGGKLGIESKMGKGSRFYFTIPLAGTTEYNNVAQG